LFRKVINRPKPMSCVYYYSAFCFSKSHNVDVFAIFCTCFRNSLNIVTEFPKKPSRSAVKRFRLLEISGFRAPVLAGIFILHLTSSSVRLG
jgi:hypothetical protein